MSEIAKPERSVLTVAQFSIKHPAFTAGSLRWMIFNSESRYAADGTVIPGSGLCEAIIRVGRRVLIDEVKFFHWLDSQNMAGRRSGRGLRSLAETRRRETKLSMSR